MISLCMIIKDEEETLEKCLKSVKNLVDEIVIVDTGSKDKSKEIAFKYTDKVYDFKWSNDFSAARNFSISKALNEWILILDADEIISNFNKIELEEFCFDNSQCVGRIKIVNHFKDKFGDKKFTTNVRRFFNKNYFFYSGIIHEQVTSKLGNEFIVKDLDVVINHIGYSEEMLIKKDKVNRNIDILNQAINSNKSDPYLYYQLGKSYFIDKNYINAYENFKVSLKISDNIKNEYMEDLIECYGYSMVNLEKFAEALSLYKYEKYYCNSADYIFLLALVEMNNGNFTKAVELFINCTKCKEGKIDGVNSFLALYNVGVIFECLSLKEEAVFYYEKCGNYEPALERLSLIFL